MKSAYDKIMAGLEGAVAYMEGDTARGRVANLDARQVRQATGLTQADFAKTYRLPLATVRDWEQGRRAPDTGSLNFLRMIRHAPEAVRDMLVEAEKLRA